MGDGDTAGATGQALPRAARGAEKICRIDASLRLFGGDAALAAALGLAPDALAARPLPAVLSPFARSLEANAVFALLQRCAPVRETAISLMGVDGGPVVVTFDLWPQFDGSGAYTGHAGTLRLDSAARPLTRGEREAAALTAAQERLAGGAAEAAVTISAEGLSALGAVGSARGLALRVAGLGAVLSDERALFALDGLQEAGAHVELAASEALQAPFGALFVLRPAALRCDAAGAADSAAALARGLGADLIVDETADADGQAVSGPAPIAEAARAAG